MVTAAWTESGEAEPALTQGEPSTVRLQSPHANNKQATRPGSQDTSISANRAEPEPVQFRSVTDYGELMAELLHS